jgi:hypothetical protein
MRFSLKTLITDIQSRDRAYSPKCHKRTYSQCMTEDFIFTKPSHGSYFSYSRVVLVNLGLIKGFPQI